MDTIGMTVKAGNPEGCLAFRRFHFGGKEIESDHKLPMFPTSIQPDMAFPVD